MLSTFLEGKKWFHPKLLCWKKMSTSAIKMHDLIDVTCSYSVWWLSIMLSFAFHRTVSWSSFSRILLWIKYKNILLWEAVNLSSAADCSLSSPLLGKSVKYRSPRTLQILRVILRSFLLQAVGSNKKVCTKSGKYQIWHNHNWVSMPNAHLFKKDSKESWSY